jgi:hypothetical protein
VPAVDREINAFAPFEIDMDAILALPEGPEKEAALTEVAWIGSQVKQNPLWTYRPHEGERERFVREGKPLTGEEHRGQVEYHELNGRDVFIGAVVAGNRFGKTHVGFTDNLIQILAPEFLPPWLESYRRKTYNGDFRCRTVCVDLPNALKKVLLPKLRRLVPAQALYKGSFEKAWNDRDRILTFADGSWWDFLTHDMDVDAFSGVDLDRIHFDEEPPGAKGYLQFDESLTRLLDRDGDVRFTLTPLFGFSWLYYELTDNDVPRKDDEVHVVEGSLIDNPTLSDRAVQRQIKRWQDKDPGKLSARVEGRFVHFAGMIYPEFRETEPGKGGHIVPAREIPRKKPGGKPSVPIYGCVDPGIDHPTGLVFFWVNEDDTAEVFYAKKWADGTADTLAEQFKLVTATLDFVPRWNVIDQAARNRNHIDGRNVQDYLLREHGIATMPSQKAVSAGINLVKNRLTTQRLLIHATEDQLIDEFRTYRWKTQRDQGEDEKKLEPIKRNDDLLDPLRYGLMSLPQKAATQREDPDSHLREVDRVFRQSIRRLARKPRRPLEGVGSSSP